MIRKITAAALFILLASPAAAQEWARKMFDTTSHNFGVVARGAKTEFRFVLTNIYLEDVHIAGVRSSCGCTTPRVEGEVLKTYEKGAVVAHFNTPTFLGQKGATLTVTFDKPFPAEVQLQVSGYVRGDVVFQPGSVDLGAVQQGAVAEKQVMVNYGGWGNWRIAEVKSSNPHLSAQVVETGRGNGQVSYRLNVRLDEQTPPSYINEQLMLVTNDAQRTQIPLAVEGRVQPAVTVSPGSLFIGVVHPGQKVTKQLVVKGNRPFRILSVSCDDQSFEFQQPAADAGARQVHLIPVTFVAGADAGKISKTIRIETDLGDSAPQLAAYAVVTP